MTVDIVLTASELAQRGTPYHPIRPVPHIYTHVGDARNHGTGRRLPIRLIIDHTTEGSSTSIVGSMRYDARRAEKVSCTAFTGEDGVGYDVAETNTPWTTGRWNDESVSNETVGRAEWSEQFWRSERSQTIGHKIDLFTDWCRRFDIPPVWLSAEQIAEGASLQGMTMRSGVNRGICDHLEANRAAILLGGDPAKYSHHDVGAGMRQILFGTIIPTVVQRLQPTHPAPSPAPPPPPSEEPMAPYIFRLSDGGLGIRDGANGSRPLNGGEIEGPYDGEKQWTVPAGSPWEYWIRLELAAYERDVAAG